MQITTFAISVTLLFVSATTAFPFSIWRRSVTFPKLHLHKRGLPGAVYICTDKNFKGTCGWNTPSPNCRIPGTDNNAPESIGPDPGGFCILYSTADCSGNQIQTIRFPGESSALPKFAGLKCFPDKDERSVNGTLGPGGAFTGTVSVVKDDPRLAGGQGSMKNKKLKAELKEMEKDGFKEGMIGLEKNVYY
jgi:hypothetical protein